MIEENDEIDNEGVEERADEGFDVETLLNFVYLVLVHIPLSPLSMVIEPHII